MGSWFFRSFPNTWRKQLKLFALNLRSATSGGQNSVATTSRTPPSSFLSTKVAVTTSTSWPK